MEISFCENSIFGRRWTGEEGGLVRRGPFEGDPAFMFFISLFSFFPLRFLVSSFFFFLVFISNTFRCWHQYQSLTMDVSSVWRCGVLTTKGGDWVGPPTWERA